MTFPRLQLVELEDLSWFPSVVRDLATDYLQFIQTRFAFHRAIVPMLRDALQTTGSGHIVDLCSGGGGPLIGLHRDLEASGVSVRVTLTDLYPNVSAGRAAVAATSPGAISFATESVDARAVPADLQGFRTMFNSFHHFAPSDAVAMLRDAARLGQPVGVFELPERNVGALLPFVFLTPIAVAVATPFIRPFQWRRLLFTYAVPLVPLTCWWDGIVSHLRAYTVEELEELAAAVQVDDYTWRAGRVRIPMAPSHITYLLGAPKSAKLRRDPKTSG